MFTRHRLTRQQQRAFLHSLASLLHAGIPLLSALMIIQEAYPELTLMSRAVAHALTQGESLSAALGACRYDNTCLQLIAVGEASGQLDTVMQRILLYQQKTERLLKTIRKALFYPCVILAITGILISVLLLCVFPSFLHFYDNMHATLPAFTQAMLAMSQINRIHAFAILAIFSGVILFLMSGRSRLRTYGERCLWRTPLIGPLIHTLFYSRFFMQLATLLAAGVPLLQSLAHCRDHVTHPVMHDYLIFWHQRMSAGSSFSAALHDTSLPRIIPARIAVAEATGQLAEACDALAIQLEEQSDAAFERLCRLIEPAIMLVLGLSLGCIMVAMYLPIFYLGQGIG